MKDYSTDAPVFSESIRIVEKDDLVNFENKNVAPKQLLQNDLVLRTLIEALTQQLENNAQAAKDYTDGAYQQSTGYTDQKIADLINGAPDTLDTLGEIAKAMSENEDVVTALHEAMGKKANQAEMESWLGTKLDKSGDSGNTTANYTSSDTTSPSAWSEFSLFTGIEKLKEFAGKVSTMAKNLRWLYKMLGTTDISAIGDGTVTGALDELNSNLKSIKSPFINTEKILTTINKSNTIWTATDDGLVKCEIVSTSTYSANVNLNGVIMVYARAGDNIQYGFFYIKKGQTIYTREYGTYDITVYRLLYSTTP